MKKVLRARSLFFVLSCLFMFSGSARAQKDVRFEKVSKELYAQAKKEGALVVYTVWDVEHIRTILDDCRAAAGAVLPAPTGSAPEPRA